MNQAPFPKFHKLHGAPSNCEMPPSASLQKFEPLLPKLLLDEWRVRGWCSYAQGFLWIVDPDEFAAVLADWKAPSDSHVILRTAFGDMFYWHASACYLLNVDYGLHDRMTGDVEVLFEYVLGSDGLLKKTLDQPIFKKALKRLGSPERDEVYGYFPAIPLGGSHDPANLKKVKLREHLNILSQMF